MDFMAHGIDDATLTLDVGTAHASYAIGNLNSRVKTKQFRTASGSATDIYFEIDFTAPRACDTLILGGKNFSSNVTLRYGTAADDGATYDTAPIDGVASGTAENSYFAFTEATKRYWQVRIHSFTQETDYLGLVFLGKRYSTPVNPEAPFEIGFQYGTKNVLFTGGVELTYKVHANRYFERGVLLRGFTETQKNAYLTYFQAGEKTNDNELPFFWKGEDDLWYYGRFIDEVLNITKITEDWYDLNFGLIEQL